MIVPPSPSPVQKKEAAIVKTKSTLIQPLDNNDNIYLEYFSQKVSVK